MLNDRDDEKFEGQEESEYHFSDEDVSYEVDNEPTKPAAQTETEAEAKENIVTRLGRSKRMLISLGVFLVLVFVVYKMVTPSSNTPPTAIANAPTPTPPLSQNAMPAAPVAAPTQAQPISPPATVTPAVPTNTIPTPAQQAATTPTTPVVAAPTTPVTTTIPATPTQVAQQAPVQSVTTPPPSVPQTTVVVPPNQQKAPVVVSLPAVIPVQSAVPTYNPNQPATPTVVESAANVQASSASLTAESEKLMSQLQTQYTQQFNDFSSQNKVLQDQIQALTARVSVMENQLNQLVQVLTRQHQNSSMANPAGPPAQLQASDVKVAYNVQAIIPGRAWLKSDNGETLTVAEGDMIKGVGRVTKIDPYDGLVEINTGNKAVSLSYGNGG